MTTEIKRVAPRALSNGRQLNRRSGGVTLIELMVVIIVLAILGTIAVTTYRNYMIRTNRTEARLNLLRIQAAQEKFFLQNNEYADDDRLETPPPGGLGVPASLPSGFYTFAIDNYTATTYRAVATAAGGQLQDQAACRTLSIDQDGTRLPAESSGCWR